MNNPQITAMRQGGQHLGSIKKALVAFTKVGMSFAHIEAEAQRLIKGAGATPSFSTVPGYDWATCIMKNDELCHGIPNAAKKVAAGDIITIDVGLIWDGYHLDTTTSFVAGQSTPDLDQFLEIGRRSLAKAISKARLGNSIYDLSFAMQKVVEEHGFDCVYQLTGHGVGKELHMDPEVPCIAYKPMKKVAVAQGQTLAIEIMYAQGDAELKLDPDGWTYRTKDRSLSAMFEETVLITDGEPEILTA